MVRRQSPSHGLTTPVDRLMRCHPLTLIVFLSSASFEALERLTGCVYLHAYLVFKEPTWCAVDAPPTVLGIAPVPPFRSDAGKACRMSNAARLGEPSEVTGTAWPCQPKNAPTSTFATRLRLGWTLGSGTAARTRLQVSCGANVQGVSRTDRTPSSQPYQVVLLLALPHHEQRAPDRLIARQPRLRIRDAPVVHVDAP